MEYRTLNHSQSSTLNVALFRMLNMKLLSERLGFIYDKMPELEGERGQIGLVKASGASKSVVNQWITGKIKSMDIRYALNIERELGFSHIWLMTGDGDPRQAPLYRAKGVVPVDTLDRMDTIPIRCATMRLRAGIYRMEVEPDLNHDGVLQMPKTVIQQHMLNPDALVAMRVRGNSMEPMMFEDDFVVIDTSDKRPISRELFAFQFDGDACIKQLLNKGGQWYLHSLNPEHGPINVRSGQLDIIGRVVYQPGRVVTGRL